MRIRKGLKWMKNNFRYFTSCTWDLNKKKMLYIIANIGAHNIFLRHLTYVINNA